MRILILLAAFLVAIAVPTSGRAQSAPKVTDCAARTSELCWQAAQTNGGLVQANIPMVCAEVFQNQPGYVMLVIRDQQRTWINQGHKPHHPYLSTHGIVCVGIASFVSKAEEMIWCIDFRPGDQNAHVVYRGRPIIELYQYGQQRMIVDLRWNPNLPQDTSPAWQPIPQQFVQPRS